MTSQNVQGGGVVRDLGVYDVADAHPRRVESWVQEVADGGNRPSQWAAMEARSNGQRCVVGIFHDEASARRVAGL